MAMLLGNLSAN